MNKLVLFALAATMGLIVSAPTAAEAGGHRSYGYNRNYCGPSYGSYRGHRGYYGGGVDIRRVVVAPRVYCPPRVVYPAYRVPYVVPAPVYYNVPRPVYYNPPVYSGAISYGNYGGYGGYGGYGNCGSYGGGSRLGVSFSFSNF